MCHWYFIMSFSLRAGESKKERNEKKKKEEKKEKYIYNKKKIKIYDLCCSKRDILSRVIEK